MSCRFFWTKWLLHEHQHSGSTTVPFLGSFSSCRWALPLLCVVPPHPQLVCGAYTVRAEGVAEPGEGELDRRLELVDLLGGAFSYVVGATGPLVISKVQASRWLDRCFSFQTLQAKHMMLGI